MQGRGLKTIDVTTLRKLLPLTMKVRGFMLVHENAEAGHYAVREGYTHDGVDTAQFVENVLNNVVITDGHISIGVDNKGLTTIDVYRDGNTD